jgi:hypothetical protein
MIFLVVSLFAEKEVTKTAVVNYFAYPNKSMNEIKKIALKKAKKEALAEIFGDFVKSESILSNDHLRENNFEKYMKGVIHLKGNPKYANGKDLGDIQVTINAYATDKDIKKFSVHEVSLNNFVYSNKNIPLKKLKIQAENAFIIAALSKVAPKLKRIPNATKLARQLSTSLNITHKKFDPNTGSYTISGKVGYVPFILKQTIK